MRGPLEFSACRRPERKGLTTCGQVDKVQKYPVPKKLIHCKNVFRYWGAPKGGLYKRIRTFGSTESPCSPPSEVLLALLFGMLDDKSGFNLRLMAFFILENELK